MGRWQLNTKKHFAKKKTGRTEQFLLRKYIDSKEIVQTSIHGSIVAFEKSRIRSHPLNIKRLLSR